MTTSLPDAAINAATLTAQTSHAEPALHRHWVLLRGLGRDSRHWEAFPQQLQAAFPGDRVTCLNLPGTGPNQHNHCPASISEMVDWLRQHYAPSLGQSAQPYSQQHSPQPPKQQPLHLLCLSMGGLLAADWMHRFPEEVAAAVIINASSRLSPRRQRLRSRLPLLRAILSSMPKREAALVRLTSDRHVDNTDLAHRWRIFQQQQPVTLRTLGKQFWAASRFEPQPVSQPVLLLASSQDRIVDPACSADLAQFWGAELRLHRSAGHDIPLDDSAWLLNQLQRWLPQTVDHTGIQESTGLPR